MTLVGRIARTTAQIRLRRPARGVTLAASVVALIIVPSAPAHVNPVWSFGTEFRVSPDNENPNRDHHGIAGVWHYQYSSGSVPGTPMTAYQLAPGGQSWKDPSRPYPTVSKADPGNPAGLGFVQTGDPNTAPGTDYAIVGWEAKSVLTVRVSGRLHIPDQPCNSDGATWRIQKNGDPPLASGIVPEDGSQNFFSGGSLDSISLLPGDFIYLLVGPGTAHNCDNVFVDLDISCAATPCLTTIPDPSSGPVGSQFRDVIILDGATRPGTIQFTLYGVDSADCTGSFSSSTMSVGGNGTYTTPPFTLSQAGTANWVVSYLADDFSSIVFTSCGDEPVTVTKATPTLITSPQPSSGTTGSSFSDDAALSGGFQPGGQIGFEVFGPNDPQCTGGPVYSDTVIVSGNNTYTSGAFTPTQPGTYQWLVTYTGDANNVSVVSTCGDEPITVQSPTAVQLASFRATVTRGGVLLRFRTASETRTLGFNLYRQQRGKLVKLNGTLIPSVFGDTTKGQMYSWLDRSAKRRVAYTYRLQAVSLDGARNWLGTAVARR
jgi:hypothetical protein